MRKELAQLEAQRVAAQARLNKTLRRVQHLTVTNNEGIRHKTTDLYAVGIYQLASGHDSTGKVAVATIANLAASNNNEQAVVTIGIRHRF